MADKKEIAELMLSTGSLESGAKAAVKVLKDLDSVLSSVAGGIREAFAVKGYEDYKDTVARFGKDLADELLTLQLSFGRMKYAIAEAVAPIASVFVPMLNDAIQAVIRFSGVAGQFLRGLLAAVTGNQKLAAATQQVTVSEKKLETAVSKTGKAVRRSLAGFDELERLNAVTGSGSGSSPEEIWNIKAIAPISGRVQEAVDKVMAALQPLLDIDRIPLQQALAALGASAEALAALAGRELKFLWQQVMTPFAAWITERFAPVLVSTLGSALDMTAAALEPVMAGLRLLWQTMEPVVSFIGSAVLQALQQWQQAFADLARVYAEKSPVITGIFSNIAQLGAGIWSAVSPALTQLGHWFSAVFTGISQTVSATVGWILEALYGLTGYLAGAFTGNWKQAWEGVKQFLKSVVNGIIGLLNAMVSRMVSALNSVIRAANKLSFSIPGWVPEVGGRSFGLNIPLVSAPQIPYLAQGAVLPANKPFLAVVGDQRHGTNVEAPLTTIQQAVANVMGDQLSAMLAGFQALLEENRLLRQVVEGIEIGDATIGAAASRYQRRQNYLSGGSVR